MQTEFRQFMDSFLAFAVLNAGLMWLLYVALEPYVRRYCPHMLFSWTRLVAGQLRDPRVGRDILIGVSVGVLLALLRYSTYVIPSIVGSPPPIPKGVNMQFLLGARFATSTILKMIPNALQNTMAMTFIFVVVRAVSGRVWPAVVAAGLLFGVLVVGEMNDLDLVALVFAASFSVVLVTTLVKFGLLAQAAAFFTNMVLGQGVLTIDASKLYTANSVWLIVLVAGLAAFGLYASRGGEPLFGKLLPRE
jgi:serine/threonine-protein kinase